jgi:hypothetical protein
MPFALALVASALLHAAALVGSGWTLPGTHEPEPPQTIEAVLAKPPLRSEPAPEAKPAPRPPTCRRPRPATTAQPVLAADKPAPAPPLSSRRLRSSRPRSPWRPRRPSRACRAGAGRIALPGKGRLRYVITRGEGGFVVGQAVHSWEHDGFTYKLQSVTETTGLAAVFKPARVFQSSRGEVTDDGLRPLEFRHERVGGIDTASFDWGRRIVAYAGREEAVVGRHPGHAVDVLPAGAAGARSRYAGNAHRHRAQAGKLSHRSAGRGSPGTAGRASAGRCT